MNKHLKIAALLLVFAAVLFTGCSNKTEQTAVAADAPESVFVGGGDDELYVMVTFVSGVDYWVPVYETFRDAGQQLNVKTLYKGCAEYDVNKQLAVFEQVVAMNPAGIALCPMNPDAFTEAIDRAIAKGIRVITFATDSPASDRSAFITSDNKNEGKMAADALAEAIGGKGELAVLENPGQLNHDIRISSFIERIETEWPDCKVVARAATNQDPNKAYQAVQTITQAHPNVKGFFMPEASSGMGAAQAAVELDSGIQILCCDVNDSILDMIKGGQMFGAINPNQGIQGYYSMLTLYVSAHGLVDPMNDYMRTGFDPNSIPLIDNGLAVVTKDIADDFYVAPYLERRGTKRFE